MGVQSSGRVLTELRGAPRSLQLDQGGQSHDVDDVAYICIQIHMNENQLLAQDAPKLSRGRLVRVTKQRQRPCAPAR